MIGTRPPKPGPGYIWSEQLQQWVFEPEAMLGEEAVARAEERQAQPANLVWDYDKGDFVEVSPEEFAKREAYYERHPLIAPPGTPGKYTPDQFTQRLTDLTKNLFPEYQDLAGLQTALTTTPRQVEESLRVKGRTPETEEFLKLLGFQPQDIEDLFKPAQWYLERPKGEIGPALTPISPERVAEIKAFNDSLQKLYPESDVQGIVDFAKTNTDDFLKVLKEQGRSAETDNILRAFAPSMTEQDVNDFWTPPATFPTAGERQATLFGELGYNPAPPVKSFEERQERVKVFQAYRKAGGQLAAGQWELYGMPATPFDELPMLSPGEHQAVINKEVQKQRNLITVFGQGLKLLPKQLGATILQAIQGQGGASVTDKDWADRFIEDANKDLEKFTKEVTDKYGESSLPISPQDMATLPQNIAFSLTSMGAGLAVGVPTALIPLPGARVAAWALGTAASGAVAYNMTTYQIMQQYLEMKNEEMIAQTGVGLTAQEEQGLKEAFSNKAMQYGLWEAIPEAVSNLAFVKILTLPLGRVVGKAIATKIIGKLGGLYGEELLTETITQKGQSAIEVEARLREKNISWVEAFKEIAPQTFLLTTVLGGAGQVGVSSVRKIKESLKKEAGDSAAFKEINENITEGVFDEIEVESESLIAKIVRGAKEILAEEKGAIEIPFGEPLGKPGKPIKETWQMTSTEYVKWYSQEWQKQGVKGIKADTEWAFKNHKVLIKDALSEGKPVPAEVLKDYPDLAAKAPSGFVAPTPKGSVEQAIETGLKQAKKTGQNVYVFPTADGMKLGKEPPPFRLQHYIAKPDGTYEFVPFKEAPPVAVPEPVVPEKVTKVEVYDKRFAEAMAKKAKREKEFTTLTEKHMAERDAIKDRPRAERLALAAKQQKEIETFRAEVAIPKAEVGMPEAKLYQEKVTIRESLEKPPQYVLTVGNWAAPSWRETFATRKEATQARKEILAGTYFEKIAARIKAEAITPPAEVPTEAAKPPVAPPGAPKEVFPGITEVAEVPVVAEEVTPTPPIQPPQTVEIPAPPPSPDARNKVVAQSQEIVKQSLPGAFNRLFQKIPGIKQAMRFERPALIAFTKDNPHLVVAQVAEVAARSDVAARQVATRLPLFKQLHSVFGEKALRGEKTDIKFVGTEEQATSPITGTLLDICQNPELYELTPKQLSAIQAINTHNNASLDYVVNQYGAEIGKFAPKPDGAFLSNVDIDEGIIDWLGSETRAIATGRGKTRYWQTARDRMVADKTFKPMLDIKQLIEGMDSFKSSAAAGVTFRETVGGKTRLEAMQETHPKLYEKMTGLREELQSLKGSLARLETKLSERVDEFLASPAEDINLAELQEALDVKLERGARAGLNIEALQEKIDKTRESIKELRPAWKIANLKPYVFVQEGLYRYFKPEEAKYIIQSRKTTSNPVLTFIERWRGQAFSGDFSPFAIQGAIGVLADPIGSLEATAGGIKAGFENRDFLHSITVDGLIADINSDIEGWAEFASLMGRNLTGVPREYAAGFLSSIPGFDKFTETTYIVVTRGTKNLYDRTWQGLVKSGVPILEAKVAAIEVARKVYPLVDPAKLGQSQARAAVLRAMPTSYSFIRQPVTLISQASMGYAKLATFQKLAPQERVAVRTITTMAASILITSAISAAISAKVRGEDDEEVWQAIWDAINPDPYNGKFASLIIGEFRIPLGGPYRSIFRAIFPQDVKGIPFPVPFAGIPNFVVNRITPAIKTQINLLRNKDYYGKQIIKGQFPENIIRGLLYELEGALPLSLGELMAGIRREEGFDEILQQAAAQFVGVNLMKLDNTYFHKLVRNLGLPTRETPSLYSKDIPNFTTKDLYGGVTKVLSDVTIDEIKQRKGYPKLIAEIIETRDLKREVDLLPNHSPISLNADPTRNNGITYKQLYQQWSDRQALVEAGNDAEYTPKPELVGGKYKYRTYKGEDALKAFDKDNPQAELGNMTRTQFVLLDKYWTITDKKEQAQFLEDNPEISINPRIDYLKTHPKENAQLAIWGQAKVLSQAAYDEAQRLLKALDIPDSAVADYLPPKDVAKPYFDYQDAVDKYAANSPQARLIRANSDKLNEWMGLERIDESVKGLELKVKTYDKSKEFGSYSDKDSPNYLDDVVKDKDGKTARDRAQEKFRTGNAGWLEDLDRIEAHSTGTRDKPTPDATVNKWVDHGKVSRESKGYDAEEKVWYLDNPDIHKWALDNKLTGDDGKKWNEPALRIQVKPENRKIETQVADFKKTLPDISKKTDPAYKTGYQYAVEQLYTTKEGVAYKDDLERIEAHQHSGAIDTSKLSDAEKRMIETYNVYTKPTVPTKDNLTKAIDSIVTGVKSHDDAAKLDPTYKEWHTQWRDIYSRIVKDLQDFRDGKKVEGERLGKDIADLWWDIDLDAETLDEMKKAGNTEAAAIYQEAVDKFRDTIKVLLGMEGHTEEDLKQEFLGENPEMQRFIGMPNFVEDWVKHGQIVRDTSGNSAEVKVWLYDNKGVHDWAKKNELLKDLDPETDWNIPALRIDVAWRKQDTEYQVILDKYPTAQSREQTKATQDYLSKNPQYKVARIQRDGYQLGLTDVSKWTAYNQLSETGFWRERYRKENPDFDIQIKGLQKAKGQNPWADIVPGKIPVVQYDQIYDQFKDKFDAYDDVQGTDTQRATQRKAMLDGDTTFKDAYYRRAAYGKFVPVKYVNPKATGNPIDDYVGYSTQEKPENWKRQKGTDEYYEDDWWMIDHPEFYKEVYLGVLGNERKDYRKVPTRAVFAKYLRYLELPEGKSRQDLRFNQPDLEAWLLLTGKVTKSILEQEIREKMTPAERLAAEVAERMKRIRKLEEPVKVKR